VRGPAGARRCLWLACILALLAAPVHADDYTLVHYTSADGLPVDAVADVAQTSDGFVWLATRGGLVRFDGRAFVTYSLETHPDLRSERFVFAEALDEAVWLVTEQGELYRFEGGTFERFDAVEAGATAGASGLVVSQPVPFPVRPLLATRSGRLLVAHEGGVAVYDPGDRSGLRPLAGDLITSPVTALHEDARGGLWIGTWQGEVYHVTPGGARAVGSVAEGSRTAASAPRAIRDILAMPDGSVWLATADGPFWKPPASGADFTPVFLEGERVAAEFHYAAGDDEGGVWLDGWNGRLLRASEGVATGWVSVADTLDEAPAPGLPFEDLAPWSLRFQPRASARDCGTSTATSGWRPTKGCSTSAEAASRQ
jgi:ligand-binding sensor domain-containing protein